MTRTNREMVQIFFIMLASFLNSFFF
ncbi:hypothetical protein DCAR_0208484 [Daucus carota subsp. sativus]|uniref:Uncharacterized protein n=1 Tax=Daucus carota subsp. sativus TaxID=79200 RepID=A0AAF0WGQ6_DAUCS|nr:hypothetical protein DCAR_0208484 [Daucus carota subsp. sativus]